MPGRRGENIRRSCEILPRFYGGSGSRQEEIHKALDYGVVKMNVDTDMQYAFTRAVAGQMFKNDDGVLKVDGEVGNKKAYDPRSYLALVFQFCAGPGCGPFPEPLLAMCS